MPSPLLRAREVLQDTRDHIQTHDCYRFAPVYSVLLLLIVRMLWFWPYTQGLRISYFLLPWLLPFSFALEDASLYLAMMLGLIGLMRKGWIAKILSAAGVYYSFSFLFWPDWSALWMDVTWYTFDIPIAWITRIVGSDAYMQTGFYAVYALALWLLLRPFLKLAWRRIVRLEDTLVAHYPTLERFRQPVI